MTVQFLNVPLVCLALLSACTPLPAEKKPAQSTAAPPMATEVSNNSPDRITLKFDKEISADPSNFMIVPEVGISAVECHGQTVEVYPSQALSAGEEYFIKGTVQDSEKNSTSFGMTFFGYNPDLPVLKINEFTTNGSGKHPDTVELYVKKGGNAAGITLFGGTKTTFQDKFILPSFSVKAGDYVLIHLKVQGIETEVDETERKDEAKGYDSSDMAWDFWVQGGSGLSGNNGALTLYLCPFPVNIPRGAAPPEKRRGSQMPLATAAARGYCDAKHPEGGRP
ncbi:MAG: hypothetical protein IKT97_08145 [Spirochaetia bacterium]|nr:hypothetical protein [Spirochaetia bacterium]